MATKQNSYTNKKDGEITHVERAFAAQQAESVLKNVKEKKGDVIHIVINSKTTIELPAHLSKEEIDARVKRYIELHKLKV